MLNISADIDKAERLLSDLARKQLPFATALSLNDTAADVRDEEEREMSGIFDRPTPFTLRAIAMRRANKSTLTATVSVKPVQAGYLKRQAKGGKRKPKGRALVIGVGARRNKYGNLPKAALGRVKARADVFIAGDRHAGTKHLPAGVYQRPRKAGGGLKLLMSFEETADYSVRWRFQDLAARRARSVFADNFYRRLAEAIRTANR